jgi:hypothetical protein
MCLSDQKSRANVHIAGVEMGGADVELLLALVPDLQCLYNYIDIIP